MAYNPDLHLFVDDHEVHFSRDLWRSTQILRKEGNGPVLVPDGGAEGTAIGYGAAVHDVEGDVRRLYYQPHKDQRIYAADSVKGAEWTRKGVAMKTSVKGQELLLLPADLSPHLAPWFEGARFVAAVYNEHSIHVAKSTDGLDWELSSEAVLPGIYDRSSLYYDPVREIYMLTSRPLMLEGDVAFRRVGLWESRNLRDFAFRGTILRADAFDRPYDQLYGMQIFRYGRIFLGLLEVYHAAVERLDTQLAYSIDGSNWRRTDDRAVILPCGGEGGWDSHWTVPTLNSPFLRDGRHQVLYSGASTKHGSQDLHRRAIGLASLRQDGWVSLEAGRSEGVVVTALLPLRKPMRLKLNVSAPSGYAIAEILDAQGEALPGYGAEDGRIERPDAVRLPVSWNGVEIVRQVPDGQCRLRLRLYQGSLFSYVWEEA